MSRTAARPPAIQAAIRLRLRRGVPAGGGLPGGVLPRCPARAPPAPRGLSSGGSGCCCPDDSRPDPASPDLPPSFGRVMRASYLRGGASVPVSAPRAPSTIPHRTRKALLASARATVEAEGSGAGCHVRSAPGSALEPPVPAARHELAHAHRRLLPAEV